MGFGRTIGSRRKHWDCAGGGNDHLEAVGFQSGFYGNIMVIWDCLISAPNHRQVTKGKYHKVWKEKSPYSRLLIWRVP